MIINLYIVVLHVIGETRFQSRFSRCSEDFAFDTYSDTVLFADHNRVLLRLFLTLPPNAWITSTASSIDPELVRNTY